MALSVVSVAERPELARLLDRLSKAWPEFMTHDPLSELYYRLAVTEWADFVLVATDPAAVDQLVAVAYSVPFHWSDHPDQPLPAGHDAMILQAVQDRTAGRSATMVGAVEITVDPARQGTGVSQLMLDALRRNTARLGYRLLVAPVRPNNKHQYPELSTVEYATRTRPDGLPVDPWLRVHVRAGGRIGPVAPCSLTVAAPLAHWRAWTGLPFDRTAAVQVPGALVPVHCDLQHDHAVYVEPNIWVRHELSPPR